MSLVATGIGTTHTSTCYRIKRVIVIELEMEPSWARETNLICFSKASFVRIIFRRVYTAERERESERASNSPFPIHCTKTHSRKLDWMLEARICNLLLHYPVELKLLSLTAGTYIFAYQRPPLRFRINLQLFS